MVKIVQNNIQNYIKGIDKEAINGVLIYGPNDSLSSIYSKEIEKKIAGEKPDPMCMISISDDGISENPTIIADEFFSISMFGGRKLIKVKASKDIAKHVKNALEEPKGDNFLLIKSGELTPSSGLRKFCEASKHIAVIACYDDDKMSIRGFLTQELNKYSFKYSGEIIAVLLEKFDGNRMSVINELQKLDLYKGDERELTIDDIEQCIISTSEKDISEFINAYMNKNFQESYNALDKIHAEGGNYIGIIRIFIAYLIKLHLAKGIIENGADISTAVSAIKPPIFFKQKPVFISHLNKWKMESLNNILSKLLKLETEIKSGKGIDDKLLFEKLLYTKQ